MKSPILLSTLFSSFIIASAVKVDRLVSRHYREDDQLSKRDAGFANGGSSANAGKDKFGRPVNKNNFELSFYHVNDVHAHLDEFRSSGSSCTDVTKGCVGGYARVKEVVGKQRPTKKHSLFLNAGDEFQGTLFFTLYEGEAISTVLNQLGFDAFTIGNHEFDKGDDVLAAFLKNLTFPAISANIHTDNKKLAKQLVPYKLFNTGKYRGMDLAVVAVTTETTKYISQPGKGTTFEDPVAAVKRTVKAIKRLHPTINKIVALTHIGYEEDIRLAKETTDISLIIGGHSHTLLGNMTGAAGSYPTIVNNAKGEEVFVVTSYRWGEYLGYIDLEFDRRGRIVSYEGAPIHLTNATAEDPKVKARVKNYAKGFDVFAKQIVGFTETPLDQTTCQTMECNLGDLVCDAMAAFSPSNTTSVFLSGGAPLPEGTVFAGALTNAGGIRAGIEGPGNMTYQQVLEVFPFGNTVTELKFSATQLWNIFEGIVSKQNQEDPALAVTSFVQVSSSIRFEYDPAGAVGSRLKSLTVGDGKVVSKNDTTTTYILGTIDFLATGGDGFWPAKSATEFVTLDTLDSVFVTYLKKLGERQGSPTGVARINIQLDGRISP